MKTLKDLFQHQLKDLYNAEGQFVDVLPTFIDEANDSKLKSLFEKTLEETKEQKDRIKAICEDIDIKPTGEKCHAMEGLIDEAKGFMEEDAEKEVSDAGLIAEAQRIAHYGITGYGTIARYAKELEHNAIAEKLSTIMDEKYDFDKKLNDMAEDRLNRKAISVTA